mgnify:CR=1 FL=1
MTTEIILLKLKTNAVRCEVYVNGVPVTYLESGEAKGGVDIPVNQYLIEGDNRFQVIMHAGVEPGHIMKSWAHHGLAQSYTGDDSLTISCVNKDTKKVFFTENWQGALQPTPFILTKSLQLSPPYSTRWLWRQAAPLEPTDIPAGYHYLKSLYDLIKNGNAKAFVDTSQVKFKEHGIAYGVGMKGMEKNMISVINSHRKSDDYSMLPINRNLLQARLAANNKILEFRRADWGHAIQFNNKHNSDNSFYLPISIGKISNEWKVLK